MFKTRRERISNMKYQKKRFQTEAVKIVKDMQHIL